LQGECYDIVRKAALEAQKKLEDRLKAQAVEISKPAKAEEQENAAELSLLKQADWKARGNLKLIL